jgi:hypothetical protein
MTDHIRHGTHLARAVTNIAFVTIVEQRLITLPKSMGSDPSLTALIPDS